MSLRIGNPKDSLDRIEVDEEKARAAVTSLRQRLVESVADSRLNTGASVRQRVRQDVEAATGRRGQPDGDILRDALQLGSLDQPDPERRWLVYHFWEQIPEERRRGPKPEPGKDFPEDWV